MDEQTSTLLRGSFSSLAITAIFLLMLYSAYGVVYRLYLSPIAGFPGPRFAALTFWNEFYYDVWLGGRYTWKLLEYHEQYGPIIRINPYEIHIKDPGFYEELYVGASKRKSNKWYWSMRMFGQIDNSAFDTLDHDKHRMRSEPWKPYFSKASVARLQPTLIQSIVDKLCLRLAEHQTDGRTVQLTNAYACLTSDVISEYTFPQGYNYLDEPEFNGDHYKAWMGMSKMSHLLKQFGWLYSLLSSIPLWLTKYTSPETHLILSRQQENENQAKQIIQDKQNNKLSDYRELTARPSLMQAMLESNLPPSEKAPERIAGEAQTAIGAGTLTSTHCLKTATYHILVNEPVLERLMTELNDAIPDPDSPPDLRALERLPYLMAILYESLRLFYGVSHRLQRIFPDRELQYREWTIPAGTPISMSALHVHDDAEIFPEPYRFQPERWLPLETEGVRLSRYLCSFGKGSRQCVGMELGKAEILTALANVFRRFGRQMRLVDCVRERDVDCRHDYFNPSSSRDGNGVVVFVEKEGQGKGNGG